MVKYVDGTFSTGWLVSNDTLYWTFFPFRQNSVGTNISLTLLVLSNVQCSGNVILSHVSDSDGNFCS